MNDFYNDENININAIDDKLMSKFNIIDLFGKEVLEDIQEKISKATGLAFVTVDYKGDPITKLTSFTKFCSEVRKRTNACECKASDAFGGIQAAVTQKNWMYFCPCGLLEIAIPIIVRGHYLGGFIGGQVRCLDAPENMSKLENVLNNSKHHKEDEQMKKLFNEVPIYEYERFVNVAELISLIINQLGEKEAYSLVQKDSLKKKLQELENSKRKLEIENDLKNIEIINLKAELNPYFLINVMNSISNLAVVEDSPKTNEMIIMFSEYLKQNFCNSKVNVSLIDELENIEMYLKIQKFKYGELLNYSIDISEDMLQIQKVPNSIILPFIENAVFYGIGSRVDGGNVYINVYYENEDVVISISDSGVGLSDEKRDKRYKIFNGAYEGDSIQISIENARKKIITLFGKEYDTIIEKKENIGTKSIIRYPRNFDERNV